MCPLGSLLPQRQCCASTLFAAPFMQDPTTSTGALQLLQALGMGEEATGSEMPAAAGNRDSSARPPGEGSIVDMVAMTMLHKGAQSGDWSGDEVRKLVKMGANVPMVTFDMACLTNGPSLLHIAAQQVSETSSCASAGQGVAPMLQLAILRSWYESMLLCAVPRKRSVSP